MNKLSKLLKDQERDNYVEKEIEDIYNTIAEKTGRTPEEISKIGGIESQHGKYTNNMAGSRAKGLFQIMPQIAKDLGFADKPIESLNTQEDIMSNLINEHQNKLGSDLSIEDLYLLHNQGLGKGKQLIKSPDSQKTDKILSKKIIESNPRLYKDKTVGESKDEIKKMLDEGAKSFEFKTKFEDLFTKDQIPASAGQVSNPNEENLFETNILSDLVNYIIDTRDRNIEKKELKKKEQENNKFFEELLKLKKERAEKVKKKYGREI